MQRYDSQLLLRREQFYKPKTGNKGFGYAVASPARQAVFLTSFHMREFGSEIVNHNSCVSADFLP